MIFAARQLQERCQEQNMDLWTTLVDLTKACDTVSREGLWKMMAITTVRQFHDGIAAHLWDDGVTSDAFPVTNGAKQRCVLTPTLFSIIVSAMLTNAFRLCSQLLFHHQYQ